MHTDRPAQDPGVRAGSLTTRGHNGGQSLAPRARPGYIDRLHALRGRLGELSSVAESTLNAVRGQVPEAVDQGKEYGGPPNLDTSIEALERMVSMLENQLRELSQTF